MPSPYPNALKTPESDLGRLTRENETLRGIAARIMPCHYCGAADISRCPHGFPGCALADDLMGFDACANRELREARAERDRFIAARDAARTSIRDIIRELNAEARRRGTAEADLARLRAGIADLAAGWAPWVTPQCAEALRRLLEPDTAPTKETSDEAP